MQSDSLSVDSRIQSRKLEKSIKFLISNRSQVSNFSDIEDFIYHLINNPGENILSGFEHHFGLVRLELSRRLWAKGIFIGISVVEILLFSVIQDERIDNPFEEFLRRIYDFGLHRPGFIIYPVHSLGVLGFGIHRFITGPEAYFISADSGIAVTPQANSQEALYSIIEEISTAMGINQKVPRDLLEHYIQSRSLEWLKYNPLMLVRVRNFSTSYYENQFLLLIKLKISKTVVLMLSALGKTSNEVSEASKSFSSSQVNNFQTLDIKHYLVFQASPENSHCLDIQCVPMNVNREELSEISSLNIELNSREWKYRRKMFDRIKNSLTMIEEGYIENCISIKKETLKSRVYRKIFDSLKYFERSFRKTSGIEDGVVNLAIAFEILLTDYYALGATKKILKHLRFALRNVKGTRMFQQSVKELYQSRGAIVHLGRTDGNPDLHSCRRAYIYAFLFMVEHLHTLPINSETPISDLLR